MYQKVISFYTKTIQNNYEDLGFIQLINPKIKKFKPPTDETLEKKVAIKSLNTLLNGGCWSSFNHIEIEYDDMKINASRVFRDTVTDHNFDLKKNYFALMVRCRFFEVLLFYNSTLSVLKEMCEIKKFKLNQINYVECVTCLFGVINNTVKMFDFMLTILKKMNLSAIWPTIVSYSNLISTYNMIYNYVINLKTYKVVRGLFVNKPGVLIEKLADDYVKYFTIARYDFRRLLQDFKTPRKNHCYSEGLIMTKEYLKNKFKNTASFINETLSCDTNVSNYERISKYLNDFCEHFIKTDYIDTGIYKIHKNYFWKWE
ncbi:uncharacterized protein LOC126910007 isoform X2 [Daktulosphaira vitifoliae]|nr:uncharacterized protein LOC126910007 isoform X2 [Daktulosphaira vitifoliae]